MSKELISEAKALLNLLPDPNIILRATIGTKPRVFSEYLNIKLATCEVKYVSRSTPEDLIKLHGSRLEALVEDDIDAEFRQEMGERNATFFAGSPEIIRKLVIALKEATEKDG